MTLVLTHLSQLGVIMAADSAITYFDGNGSIRTVDQIGRQKVFKVPSIRAGVSYWGFVGEITRRFDWTMDYMVRQQHKFHSVRTLADYISSEMNRLRNNQILQYPTGVHVAGFDSWPDNVRRPVFLHIHNGHGHYGVTPVNVGNQWKLQHHWIKTENHKPFTVHQDFPDANVSLAVNLARLSHGTMTRNGDFYLFSLLFPALQQAIARINLRQGISIPSRPNDLCSRKGLIHTLLQNTLNLYKISNQYPVVGGKVSSIAFDDNSFCPG